MKKDAPRIFEPEYYDRLAEVEGHHWWSRGMLALTRDVLIRLAPPGRLLDAGCGTGGQLACLPESWKRRSFGIDLSPVALQHARLRLERPLAISSVSALPYRRSSFAAIVCQDVLQHLRLQHLGAALSEFRRVLQPHGMLLVRSNSRIGQGGNEELPEDFRRFSLLELIRWLELSGFSVERASYANSLPSLPVLLRPRDRGEGYGGLEIRCLPVGLGWLNAALFAYMRAEAFLIRNGLRLPYGQTTFAAARKV